MKYFIIKEEDNRSDLFIQFPTIKATERLVNRNPEDNVVFKIFNNSDNFWNLAYKEDELKEINLFLRYRIQKKKLSVKYISNKYILELIKSGEGISYLYYTELPENMLPYYIGEINVNFLDAWKDIVEREDFNNLIVREKLMWELGNLLVKYNNGKN